MVSRVAARPARHQRADREVERSANVQALTLLNLLAEREAGSSLTDLSRASALAPSTTHRLLTALRQGRFVRFDRELTRWFVGVQPFTVGNAFLHTRDLARAAKPYLQALMEETQETANFAVEDEGMTVYLSQVQSRQFMRAIARPGGRVFMHSSALGKAMLAALPRRTAMKIVADRGLPVFTPHTLGTAACPRRTLDEVERQGFAVDDEEYLIGLRCVAAALCDEEGTPLGAVSVSGPTVRVTRERVAELGQAVRRVAGTLTAELGGRRLAAT
ncbi:MAG: IclR family transcriptional regulator [Acetobacteraceae bacterium]